MGRGRAFPLMMSLLLLAACAAGGGERTGDGLALDIRREYAAMTACAGRFRISADYGQRVFDCVVDVTYDVAAGGTLTLVEPEMARGVSARIAKGETTLSYRDFTLDAGPLTGDGLTPIEALPTLLGQLTRGYIAGAALEGDTLEITCRQGDDPPGTGLEAVLVFDAAGHTPRSGELWSDGVRVVDVQVESFTFSTGETGETGPDTSG